MNVSLESSLKRLKTSYVDIVSRVNVIDDFNPAVDCFLVIRALLGLHHIDPGTHEILEHVG